MSYKFAFSEKFRIVTNKNSSIIAIGKTCLAKKTEYKECLPQNSYISDSKEQAS